MTVLCDKSLKQAVDNGYITINPPLEFEQWQPASIDLRLSDNFIVLDTPNNVDHIECTAKDYTIKPGEFLLGSTLEYVEIPVNMVARVEGRSSYGRLGLIVHVTAGFIDPGFKGTITLEFKNISNEPITVRKGDRICQLVFEYLDDFCEKPYDGNYQGQRKTKNSALRRGNFDG